MLQVQLGRFYLRDGDAVRAVGEDGRVVVDVRDPDNDWNVAATTALPVGARDLFDGQFKNDRIRLMGNNAKDGFDRIYLKNDGRNIFMVAIQR